MPQQNYLLPPHQNLNLALSGARTKTPDLYALDVAGGSPTEPMTLESWENYREVSKNQTNIN